MKNSFVLLELIVATILASTFLILATFLYKDIVVQNQNIHQLSMKNLNQNILRAFLEKNRNELNSISFKNSNLYFKNELLYIGVLDFVLLDKGNFYEIQIDFIDDTNILWYLKK